MSGFAMLEDRESKVESASAHLDRGPARKTTGSLEDSFADVGDQLAQPDRSASAVADEGFSGVGQELPDREHHERSFGCSFSNVRVYTDAAANKACAALNARAYTVGNRIAFAESSLLQNRALVAHELTHVGQHTGQGPSRKSEGGADDDGIDRSGEDEAERVEAAVGDGKPARAVLGGADDLVEGGETAKQGPARKAKGPARSSPWGSALTLDAGELKASGSYNMRGATVSVPVPGVPGLFAFLSTGFGVKAQFGSNFIDNTSYAVSLEGSVEGGLSFGDVNTFGGMYLSVNGGVAAGFEFKQVDDNWHFQGDIKFELFAAFGVKVARGYIADYRKEFGKTEVGKLTGVRVIGNIAPGQKPWSRLDGGPSWSWGPDIQAVFDQYSNSMASAAKYFKRNT